jgi:hypothetical protein
MKLIKNNLLLSILVLFFSSMVSSVRIKIIEDDLIIKFSNIQELLVKEQMDLTRSKIRGRMNNLKKKANGIYIYL